MKPVILFPYTVASGALSLMVKEVKGGSLVGETSIDAYSEPQETVVVTLAVNVDADAMAKALPSGESIGDHLSLGIRVMGKESRIRRLHGMPDSGDEVVLTFLRSEWVGSVDLMAVAVRNSNLSSPLPGYASDKGALVAMSDEVTLQMDHRAPSMSGDHFEVRWASFKKDPRFQIHAGDLFAISFEGDQPIVVLNSDIQHAHAILESRGTHGAKARVRDATFFLIAHQVWSSLIGDAQLHLRHEAAESPDASTEDVMEALGGWRALILADWAPYLVSTTDPLDELMRGETSALIDRLPNAIQQRFNTVKGFVGLTQDIRTLGSLEE